MKTRTLDTVQACSNKYSKTPCTVCYAVYNNMLIFTVKVENAPLTNRLFPTVCGFNCLKYYCSTMGIEKNTLGEHVQGKAFTKALVLRFRSEYV
jgi:hypothetical protein